MAGDGASRDAALIDAIVDLQRRRAASEARSAAMMADYVDQRRAAGANRASGQGVGGEGAGELEAKFAADELGLATTTPTGTIERRNARTRRVRSRLPRVWHQHTEGLIDDYKVSKIDDAAQCLVFGGSLVRLDRDVVQVAPFKTPSQLQTWLNRFVARVEPAEATRRYRRAFGDRTVYMSPDADGMGWLNLCHNQLDLAQIDARLEQMARALGADDPRTMDQRKADLAVDLLLGRIGNGATTAANTDRSDRADGADNAGIATEAGTSAETGDTDATAESATAGPAPKPPNPAPTVIGVVVPIQTLIGEADMPGETLDRRSVVPADLIRERAVQPGTLFYKLLTDSSGNLLDVTEAGRYPSHKLGFAIRARDGTSRFPTSSVPADRCDLDHTIAHSNDPNTADGPTAAANLGPLDRRTHNAKTAGILRLRQPVPGAFEWTTPTGHTYTTRAEPLPVTEWLADDDLPFYRPEDHPEDPLNPDDLEPDHPLLDDLHEHERHATLPTDPEPHWWREIRW